MDGALPARARGLRHARPHAGEGATTFELFFDLVYVFAVTQVTDLISHEHGAEGVPHGLILFGMLWWTWCTFVWLGNQLRADVGLGAVGRETALFAIAMLGEWLSVYLTSRHGSWRIYSASHWTERFELFVLIVLGESLVAVGVGAGEHPLTIPLLLAAGLGVVLAICLWWLYFDLVAAATGRRVAELAGTERIRIAFEAYVYGHFPLVAGVLLAAVGVEGALRLAGTDESLGAFYGLCLVGGVALHLIGHLIFDLRVQRARNVARACALVILVGLAPAIIRLPALGGLAAVTMVLVVLVVFERLYFAELRRQSRDA